MPSWKTLTGECQLACFGRICRLGILGLYEEIDLLGNDLATVVIGAILICPAGVVDSASDHEHSALGDVFRNALADAAKAGDSVPFRLGLALVMNVLVAARCGERQRGDFCP